jgi:hypothetical protein
MSEEAPGTQGEPGGQAAEAGTVVYETASCLVLLTGTGFYAKCTRCPWVTGYTAAKFIAMAWADGHEGAP